MLAKLTAKNQLTLPKKVVGRFAGVEYFDVSTLEGRIVLTPVRLGGAEAVRSKLAELGIEQRDVDSAIAWARRRR